MSSNNKLTAVILAGGLGTRLRPVVGDFPKVLAPINNRPFLSYILDQLICCGFSRVVLCTGYGADKVRATFGDFYKDLSIMYSRETVPLGTGGALRNAIPYVKDEHILVMNGDSYIDVDLNTYIEWYFQNDIIVSLLLTMVSDTGRYGRVDVDGDGLVSQFVEKGESAIPGWINAGIYILEQSLFLQTHTGGSFSLEHDFFPKFVGKGLRGFQSKGAFIDIGTPESYDKAEIGRASCRERV